jgi:hypothetical protein
MKTLLMLLVFISGFLIVSGLHEQTLEEAKKQKKVVYRYIPRSAIDEQYYGTPASAHFQGMFGEGKSPWLEARTPQEEAGTPRYEWAAPAGGLLSAWGRGGSGAGADSGADSGTPSEADSDADSDAG